MGRSSSTFSKSDFDSYRNTYVGFVFQEYNILNEFSIEDNLSLALELQGKKKNREKVKELLDQVDLAGFAKRKPNTLSGGQKQRIAIARALIKDPKIIMADEPTGALDKEASAQVHKILQEIAAMGKLVIIVTHSKAVANMCSRIIRLDDGVVVSDEMKNKPKQEYVKYKEVETKSIKTKDVAKLSFRNIIASKGRNILVSIGIAIGIAALILILALSDGITNYAKNYYGADGISTIISAELDKNAQITSSKITSVNSIDGVTSITKITNLSSVKATYNEQEYTMAKLYEYNDINTPENTLESISTLPE